MHKFQSEIFHEETGTNSSKESPAPEDGEIRRTHHKKREDWRKGTKTTESEGLDGMAWMEGQAEWRAGKAEKLKPGAENLRLTAWRMD